MNNSPTYNAEDLQNHLGIWLWLENNQGDIYMLYHKKFDTWTIPLEKAAMSEPLDAAIKRTGLEELGITISSYEVVHTQVNEYQREGKTIRVHGHLAKVLEYSGTIINPEPEKHPQTEWKSRSFVKELTDTTDAVYALQKYL